MASRFAVRVMQEADKRGVKRVVARRPNEEEAKEPEENFFALSSGYLKRMEHRMP